MWPVGTGTKSMELDIVDDIAPVLQRGKCRMRGREIKKRWRATRMVIAFSRCRTDPIEGNWSGLPGSVSEISFPCRRSDLHTTMLQSPAYFGYKKGG